MDPKDINMTNFCNKKVDNVVSNTMKKFIIEVFNKNLQTAKEVTMEIHNNQNAVAGNYNFEIAEQKSIEATKLSRENGFPLQIAIEKE